MNKSMKSIVFLALALASAAHASEDDIKWSGYLNLVGGILEDKPSVAGDKHQHPGYGSYENRFTGMQDSLFALQATKPLNNKLSITGQMVARGNAEDSFATNVEWAYVTYQLNDNSSLRAGRFRQSTFFYSDFVDVGTAYPWVTPPRETYSITLGYEGLNYLRRDTLGEIDVTTEVFGGANEQRFTNTVSISERDIFGASLTLGYHDWFTTRLLAAKADFKLAIDFDVEDAGVPSAFAPEIQAEADKYLKADYPSWDYLNAFVKADFDRWFLMAEGYVTNADMEVLFKQVRWYTSAGLRFGKVTYLLTYARSEDKAKDASDYISYPASEIVKELLMQQTADNRSMTLGVRIDTTRTTALKFDLSRIEEYPSQKGETTGIGRNLLLRAAFSASF